MENKPICCCDSCTNCKACGEIIVTIPNKKKKER